MRKQVLLKFVSLMTAVMLIGGLASSASAQGDAAGIRMQAEPAFGGNFKYGEWLPVWVEIENNGPDVKAEIQIRVTGSGGTMVFTVPVELPTVSRKRVPVYVLPNNFSRELDARLVATEQGVEQSLASTKVSVKSQPTITYMVGFVTAERGALFLIDGVELPGTTRPKVLVDLTTAELPDHFEGLRSFDCLIFNDIDTSTLTPEQVSALQTWVEQGGRLVVGGGAGAQRTAAGLPEALLSLSPQGSIEVQSLPELVTFAQTVTYSASAQDPSSASASTQAQLIDIRVAGPFVVATGDGKEHGTTSESQVLAGTQDLPLVVEKQLGSGFVDFVALDLSSSPFDAWNGTVYFWRKLLSPNAVYPDWMPPDISSRQQLASQMPYALSNLPMLDLPSTQGLALLLGFYILLVGPANYLVLRWRKRLHWAWVTIPAITLLFSVGAFGMGYAMRGTDLFVNKIAVIELQDNGSANVNSFLGLFSPARSGYQIKVVGGGLLSPLSPYYNPWDFSGASPGVGGNLEVVLSQGDPSFVRGLSVDQWSMQSFLVEGIKLDFGQVVGDFHLENEALVGTLRNESQYSLSDVVIILNKKFQRLGDLAVGGELPVNLDLSDLSSQNFGSPLSYRIFETQLNQPLQNSTARQAQVKQTILDSLFTKYANSKMPSAASSGMTANLLQGLVMIGWLNEAPPSVEIAGSQPAQQTTAVVLKTFSYRLFSSDSGNGIVLPSGLIPGALSKMPTDGGICGDPGSTAIYINRGEAVFEFSLPLAARNVQVDNLKLSVNTDGGWNPPAIAIYNWQTQEWVSLGGVSQGVNLVPEAANLVSPDGRIQVSVTGQEGGQGGLCYYLGLGLEGRQ